MKPKLTRFNCSGSFDLGKTGIKPPQPNLQSAVFIKVLQDIDGLEIRYVTIQYAPAGVLQDMASGD